MNQIDEMRDFYERNRRLGSTERQRELDANEMYYRGLQYCDRPFDWDGNKRGSAGAEALPYLESETPQKAKRVPSRRLNVVKKTVRKFSAMLLGEDKRPRVVVGDMPKLTEALDYIYSNAGLWTSLYGARNIGGGVGTVAIGAFARHGKIFFKSWKGQNVTPTWHDEDQLSLKSVRIEYQFNEEEIDPETGSEKTIAYLYRRDITETEDIRYQPIRLTDDITRGELEWKRSSKPEDNIEHSLGVCPVVWVRNLAPDDNDIDGEPDCPPDVFTIQDGINELLSESHTATFRNLDPTMLLLGFDEDEINKSAIRKGSENAIISESPDATADYMEIKGEGIKVAEKLVSRYMSIIEQAASTIFLDADKIGGMGQGMDTMKVLLHDLINQASLLREQWGSVIKQITGIIVRILDKFFNAPTVIDSETGEPARDELTGYDKKILAPAQTEMSGRDANDYHVVLDWPQLISPTLKDLDLVAQIAMKLDASGALDQESITRWAAPYFGIADGVDDVIARLKTQADDEAKRQGSLLNAGMGNLDPDPDADDEE